MKLYKIGAVVISVLVSLACTTLTFAMEEKTQELFVPEYREVKEIELIVANLNAKKTTTDFKADVEYGYSVSVKNKTIRYISQMKNSKYFYSEYWGDWKSSAGSECYTSCISMSLSYLGINKTPEDILDFGGGLTIPRHSWGGSTYLNPSFTEAYDNYVNGKGKYSPPIIYLSNYGYVGHYVTIIGHSSDNVYKVLDPAIDQVYDITIEGTSASYTLPNGKSKKDTVSSAHQYYKEDAMVENPFESEGIDPSKLNSGDSDCDGYVTANDALLVLKHAACVELLKDDIVKLLADINGDAVIDAVDALEILKIAAGVK